MAKRKISKRTPKNVVPKHVQWHPGFVTGIELDFDKHREGVTHEKEYNLNTKPLAIDVLIRKKEGVRIEDNEIGRIFRRYNIVEYKSPDDHMDIDTYYKVNGYACLFKSYGEWMDAIKAEEVTISLFRYAMPRKLFRYFRENGMVVSNPYPGIYYVEFQIRTIAMDTWAALEHRMKYKKDIPNQEILVAELKRVADELASCDLSMQTIRELITNV